MRLLFDASALLNIIKLKGPNALKYIKGKCTLSLTPYEIGNGLWKEATLLKTISIDKALQLLDCIEKAYRVLDIIEPESRVNVLRLAHELKITYYDSSYIVAAAENNLVFVTDDDKLLKKIIDQRKCIEEILGKNIRFMKTEDLLKVYNE
ncbi:MAG: hypothetical protein DRJ52_04725 [Thermoprotei archaeon]|nr:MAG: hypothetical protein DRJ52_04725 [Thermoprotei archaeon]